MKPSNAQGIARFFLKSLYEKLGETDQSMKPQEYSALATKIGLTNSEMQAAIRRLKEDLLIRFHPESTEIIRLTQKGIQEGDYWKTRSVQPMHSDPLPDTLDGVNAEMDYFAQQLPRNLPNTAEWGWTTARLELLQRRHNILSKQPSAVQQQNIVSVQQHNAVMEISGAINLLHPSLRSYGHYFRESKLKEAVAAAFELYENRLNEIRDSSRDSSVRSASGVDLLYKLFNSKKLKIPYPKLGKARRAAYEKAFTGLLSGSIGWIRNSYTHEKHLLPDLEESEALELLFVASYLLRMVDYSLPKKKPKT